MGGTCRSSKAAGINDTGCIVEKQHQNDKGQVKEDKHNTSICFLLPPVPYRSSTVFSLRIFINEPNLPLWLTKLDALENVHAIVAMTQLEILSSYSNGFCPLSIDGQW